MREIHLFIVSMNNSGSSLLERILGRCRNAVTLPAEGQDVPGIERHMPNAKTLGVARIWTECAGVFAGAHNYDWPAIRALWRNAWRRHPGYASASPRVLVEKSPPNVLRAALLQKQFPGARFLLMVRNPYAVAEGIRRRTHLDLSRCIRHWIQATRRQVENIQSLQQRVVFTYEKMCDSSALVRNKIKHLVPELDDLTLAGTFAVHSLLADEPRRIRNLNDMQIQRLQPAEVDFLSTNLAEHHDLLNLFGYRLLTAREVTPARPASTL